MTKKITATIMGIAMMATMFTGCSEKAATTWEIISQEKESQVEVTTTEIQKAPVTLYANFDKDVLNYAPTTLPDDGFYYNAFTAVANSFDDVKAWHYFFTSGDFFNSLYLPKVDLKTYTESMQEEFPNFDDETCEYFYNDACSRIKDTEAHVEEYKAEYPELAEYFELAKNKINVNIWGDFAHECLAKEDIELTSDGNIVNPSNYPKEHYDFEKIDTEVMPKIAALAEAWMEANFMGTPIPEEMTTEDFRTYIDTDEAYAYFASKGILPYKIDNNGSTKESYEKSGFTKEKTQELFVTDKVSIWTDFEYANFMMPCLSRIYLRTEDGKEDLYTVKFRIVVKPEKNEDGSWNFKLDYATFEQHDKAMDKWGTVSDRKAYLDLDDTYSLYRLD